MEFSYRPTNEGDLLQLEPDTVREDWWCDGPAEVLPTAVLRDWEESSGPSDDRIH